MSMWESLMDTSKLLKMLTRKVMQFALIFLGTTVLVSEERKARKVSQYQEFYSDIDLSSIAVTQIYNGYTVVEIGNSALKTILT